MLFKTNTLFVWTGIRVPLLKSLIRAVLVLHLFNMIVIFVSALTRFIKRSFTTSSLPLPVPKLLQKLPSPRGSILKDTLQGSPRPSPLRTVSVAESITTGSSALTSSASQTPLRSPFSKQQQSASQLTLQQQLSSPNPQSSSATSTTPKVLFTPSSKSINLRTPSALLTSPHSPFTVKTPVEEQQSRSVPSSLVSTPDSKAVSEEKTSEAADEKSLKSSPKKTPIQRRQLKGEECLRELSLQRDFEDRVEEMRRWLWTMVIKPLVEDIDKVEAAFQSNGMSHLGPLCPASMSLLNSTGGGSGVDLRPAFFVSPGVMTATSRPQTLMELAQSSRHDPMVQARLRIEKYLDVAAGVGQVSAGPRVALVRRLKAMAASPSALVTASNPDDDALLLMHLFCTFLDERLPSSDLYSAQPFTSRHFIPLNNNNQDHNSSDFIEPHCGIALVQCSRNPPAFQVVTTDMVFTPLSTCATNNCLHVLVLFSAYVEKRLAGHLGIANLRSRSLQLIK